MPKSTYIVLGSVAALVVVASVIQSTHPPQTPVPAPIPEPYDGSYTNNPEPPAWTPPPPPPPVVENIAPIKLPFNLNWGLPKPTDPTTSQKRMDTGWN